jgi:hypothetical protein
MESNVKLHKLTTKRNLSSSTSKSLVLNRAMFGSLIANYTQATRGHIMYEFNVSIDSNST